MSPKINRSGVSYDERDPRHVAAQDRPAERERENDPEPGEVRVTRAPVDAERNAGALQSRSHSGFDERKLADSREREQEQQAGGSDAHDDRESEVSGDGTGSAESPAPHDEGTTQLSAGDGQVRPQGTLDGLEEVQRSGDETEGDDEQPDYGSWTKARLNEELDRREIEHNPKANNETLMELLENDDQEYRDRNGGATPPAPRG